MSSSSPPLSLSWDILETLFDVKSPATLSPSPNGVVSSDISIDPSRNLWFRLFVPSSAPTNTQIPVIVYFHGGGFAAWAPDCKPYDRLCRKLACQSPAVVVSVNYRLSPEHRCPTQYEDGFEALRFLDLHASQRTLHGLPGNVDLAKCFLVGDSAGGNLAHHVAVQATQFLHFKAVKVIGLITIQPFFTGNERSESELRMKTDPVLSLERTDHFWRLFLPEGSDRDHPAASVFGPNGKDISNMERFPKTLIFTGGSDPLQDWGRRYYEWLIRSGKDAELVDYPDAPHCFYSIEEMPHYSVFLTKVQAFVHRLAA